MRFIAMMALVVGLGACGVGDSASEPSVGTEQAALGSCCQSGAYLCPTNSNIEYDYEQPGCGMLKPNAQTACKKACGRACTDTGWGPSGLCR